MIKTDLNAFDNSDFSVGASFLKRVLWYLCNAIFFDSHAILPYGMKRGMLRMFGAQVAQGVVIKPKVNIKYPWKLQIGEFAWIGESVWIDNLDFVSIGANACLSQGALILTGNHDYSKSTFDLMIKPIEIGEGAWVGAKAMVTQGVVISSHAVLTAGSVASSDLSAFGIYKGNPALKVKDRTLTE